jgi:hypothetical protein
MVPTYAAKGIKTFTCTRCGSTRTEDLPILSHIADVKALPTGSLIAIEGIATSNVYSDDNATNTGFLDCIYVQDSTGGICLTPISTGVVKGQKIRVFGTIGTYQGEAQITVTSLEVIDTAIKSIAPKGLTTEDAMKPDNTGLLVKVSGTVSDIHKTDGVISQLTVTDASGVGALIYINAYITTGIDLSSVTEGTNVTVTGLASIGENQSGNDPMPRIRVRNRGEIIINKPDAITSIRINAPASVTVVRNGKYNFELLLNDGATSDNLVWTTSNTAYAVVGADGTVTILNKTGTIVLMVTDPVSKLSSSIVLRIV